jgi:hypothetical protein
MPIPPTISVIDVTAQLGLHALDQLGVSHPSGHGFWPQIALGPQEWAPKFDWHRPYSIKDLRAPEASAAALVLLIGPGSVSLVQTAVQLLASAQKTRTWIYLMPSALVEEATIRAIAPKELPHAHIYRLPDSSPQTFWLVLMEQLTKLDSNGLHTLQQPQNSQDRNHMPSNLTQSIEAAMTINGALAVALVDYRSGMCLAQAGGGLNLELAAAGNTEVVRAKLKTIESLGLRRGIEDILITLADQYHLIRLIPNTDSLFLYLVLDKEKGNLALARFRLTDIERSLKV